MVTHQPKCAFSLVVWLLVFLLQIMDSRGLTQEVDLEALSSIVESPERQMAELVNGIAFDAISSQEFKSAIGKPETHESIGSTQIAFPYSIDRRGKAGTDNRVVEITNDDFFYSVVEQPTGNYLATASRWGGEPDLHKSSMTSIWLLVLSTPFRAGPSVPLVDLFDSQVFEAEIESQNEDTITIFGRVITNDSGLLENSEYRVTLDKQNNFRVMNSSVRVFDNYGERTVFNEIDYPAQPAVDGLELPIGVRYWDEGDYTDGPQGTTFSNFRRIKLDSSETQPSKFGVTQAALDAMAPSFREPVAASSASYFYLGLFLLFLATFCIAFYRMIRNQRAEDV
jgi:hypothetical protein